MQGESCNGDRAASLSGLIHSGVSRGAGGRCLWMVHAKVCAWLLICLLGRRVGEVKIHRWHTVCLRFCTQVVEATDGGGGQGGRLYIHAYAARVHVMGGWCLSTAVRPPAGCRLLLALLALLSAERTCDDLHSRLAAALLHPVSVSVDQCQCQCQCQCATLVAHRW